MLRERLMPSRGKLRPVLVAKDSGLASPEAGGPERAQEIGRGGQMLVGLALLTSSLVSLTVLIFLVRWITTL